MNNKERREGTSFRATQAIVGKQNKFGLKKFGEGKFRSKYENALAVYLKELRIKYEFESCGEEIVNETNTKLHYIPDFYLPDYDIYIEVVNAMNKRLAHKIYLYKEQYNKKLFVFDVQHLRDMFDSQFTIFDIIGKLKKKKKTAKETLTQYDNSI
jgi:hypothetical protein